VSDPVHPSPQRAPAIESSEAPPERDVNILEQVATLVGITLVRARKPFERWTECSGSVRILLALTGRPAGCFTHSIQVVAREEDF
jgi:hypothetical protein